MAINLNDNLKINVGNPIDSRYLNTGNTAYVSEAAVTTAISISQRYSGLTVLIQSGTSNVEYWFRDGVEDVDLIEKKYDSTIPIEDFVTGATNIGFFSGQSGIQTLTISTLNKPPLVNYLDYVGNYNSLYNYYYRDINGIIRVGMPEDNINKRGYVKSSYPIKSWVWNDYTGGANLEGWILIDGNISNQLGTFQTGVVYYTGASKVYTQTSWSAPDANGSSVAINNVSGSLTTGDTITIGGPVYGCQKHNNLHFRTIRTATPNTMSVSYDEAFVYVSGATSILNVYDTGSTGTNTASVCAAQTANSLYLRRIRGSGDTLVSQVGGNVVVYSSGGTGSISVANVGGGGEVYSGTSGTTIILRTIVGSGGTNVTTSGETIVINSDGGTYDLDSPSVCEVGGMGIGTVLTGKTAFELFEEILVPVQNPQLCAPIVTTTLSCSGILEIGTTIFPSLSVTSTYNAGCINPQYTATCDKRSCGVIGYCFTSTGGQVDGYYVCTTSPVVKTASSYVVSAGTQTWGTCACHCAGVQPYNSKGDIYSTPLAEDCTVQNSKTITGILPWYWGTKKVTNVITGADVDAGTKTVVCANGVLSITYNSAADDYLWFAVPNGTDTKNNWFVCASNQGSIGGTANLFAAACNVVVTSGLGCWAGCTFDVYASCVTTGTDPGIPMCMIP